MFWLRNKKNYFRNTCGQSILMMKPADLDLHGFQKVTVYRLHSEIIRLNIVFLLCISQYIWYFDV